MRKMLILVAAILALGVVPVLGNAAGPEGPWGVVYEADFSTDPGWSTNSSQDFYWNGAERNYHFRLVNGGEQYSYRVIPFDANVSYRLEFDVCMTRCDWAADLYLGLGDPDMHTQSPATWYVSYHEVDQGETGSLIYFDSEGGSYHPGGLQPAPFQLNTWYHNVVTHDRAAGTLSLQVTKVSDGSFVGEVELTGVGSFAGADRLYMSSIGHHYASGATAEGYIDNLVLRRLAGTLEMVGSYNTVDRVYTVVVEGNLAYVANYHLGLLILDVSDPGDITFVGSCDTPDRAYGLAVAGNLAFVGDHDSGLQVFDVSDPENITLVGSYDTPGRAYGVTIVGELAFVADGESGLQVLDVSNPGNITLVGSHGTGEAARGVVVVGELAFIAHGWSGLQVLNVSDPGNITLVGSYDTPGYTCNVAIADGLAFVADHHCGLQVLNVSDPGNITPVGNYGASDRCWGVTIVGGLAFVADMESGLRILDVSNPAHIISVVDYDTPGYATDVKVVGDLAFVADGDGGLLVLRCKSMGLNVPPIADAGGPYTVQATDWTMEFMLDGTGSCDPDGDAIISYEWDLDLSLDTSGDGDPSNDVDSTDVTLTRSFPIGQTEISLVVTDEHELVSGPDVTTVTVSYIEVEIDIKPGSYLNSINLGSNGVVPVAFLTSPEFDASSIDPLSVTLRGEDFTGLVRLRGKRQEPMADLEDVDDDGDLDLVVHLDTENLALEPDAVLCTLGAKTLMDGFVVSGTDFVNIVPPQ